MTFSFFQFQMFVLDVFVQGGICLEGICPGVYVLGGICPGGKCPGGYKSGGKCPGGTCRGGGGGGYVLEPLHISTGG